MHVKMNDKLLLLFVFIALHNYRITPQSSVFDRCMGWPISGEELVRTEAYDMWLVILW